MCTYSVTEDYFFHDISQSLNSGEKKKKNRMIKPGN